MSIIFSSDAKNYFVLCSRHNGALPIPQTEPPCASGLHKRSFPYVISPAHAHSMNSLPKLYLPSATDTIFLRSRYLYNKRQHGALAVTPSILPRQRANRLLAFCRTSPVGKQKIPRQYLLRSCSWVHRWGYLFCRRRRRAPCCFSWKVFPGRRRSRRRG